MYDMLKVFIIDIPNFGIKFCSKLSLKIICISNEVRVD